MAEQEAGAVTQDTATAEEQGNLAEEELEAELEESLSAEEDELAGEETKDGQEGEKPTEGPNKDKGAHQTTLEERAAQIAEKKAAEEIAKFKAETEARLEAEKKPFVDLTPEQAERLNSDYLAASGRKIDLQEEYKLAETDADKARILTEIRKIDKWLGDTENWYAQNEAKKAEWLKGQQQRETQQKESQERAHRLETTAEVFRESKGIPKEVWDTSSLWFAEQLKTDKLLGAKFADAYRLHGDVGAVEFAFNYCNEHMGKKEETAIKEKEEAKKKLSPGVTSVVQKVNANPELKALLTKAQKSGSEEDYLAYVQAKRKAGLKG